MLPAPFLLQLKRYGNASGTVACSHYSQSDADWYATGCDVVDATASQVTCQCTHMTSFAVLVGTRTGALSTADVLALDIVSYIGLGVSIFALVITVFTLLRFKVGSGD